jgi:hypothetical protein
MGSERPSRLAIVFVVVGFALSAIGIAYIIYAGRERELPPISRPEVDPRIAQLEALVKMLTHSFFLFLAFLVGSYLIVWSSRRVVQRRPGRRRSEYIDAWSSYRLTQEEIDTATRQWEESLPPDAAPGSDDAEPDDEGS